MMLNYFELIPCVNCSLSLLYCFTVNRWSLLQSGSGAARRTETTHADYCHVSRGFLCHEFSEKKAQRITSFLKKLDGNVMKE